MCPLSGAEPADSMVTVESVETVATVEPVDTAHAARREAQWLTSASPGVEQKLAEEKCLTKKTNPPK